MIRNTVLTNFGSGGSGGGAASPASEHISNFAAPGQIVLNADTRLAYVSVTTTPTQFGSINLPPALSGRVLHLANFGNRSIIPEPTPGDTLVGVTYGLYEALPGFVQTWACLVGGNWELVSTDQYSAAGRIATIVSGYGASAASGASGAIVGSGAASNFNDAGILVPFGGTVTHFIAGHSANPGSGNSTVTLQTDGSNSTISVTLASSVGQLTAINTTDQWARTGPFRVAAKWTNTGRTSPTEHPRWSAVILTKEYTGI